LVELYEFNKANEIIKNNLSVAKAFISSLPGNYVVKHDNYLWYDIQAADVVTFLSGIRTLANLKAYEPQNITRFINMQLPNGELTHWRIALMTKTNNTTSSDFRINNASINIGHFIRRQDENNSDENVYYLRKSHIISPKDESIDLSEAEYVRAMQLTSESRTRQNKTGEPAYPNGEIVRLEIRNPQNPLMIIYLLDPTGAGLAAGSDPFIGYAISYPGSAYNAHVAYAVNEQLLDQFNVDDDFGDTEYDEDR